MKKILGILIAVMMVVTLTATMVSAEQDISVKLNGEAIAFDVQPQIINDRTMVPLRAIFEALGATVEWDGDTRTVTSTKGEITIKLTIGENKLYKNDAAVELDVPGQIVDDRTLVPVRAISEAYECEVEWEADTRTVLITTPTVEEAPVTSAIIGENGNTIGIYSDPADNTDAGFYSTANLEIVADPDDSDNNVFKITAKSEGKSWAYIWNKIEYKPGEQYRIEYDARLISLRDGTETDHAYLGACFHFGGKDNGVGGGKIVPDNWSHISFNYTIPEDYTYSPDDAFGIYGDPKDEQSLIYLLDNISIIPSSVDIQDKIDEKEKAEAEKMDKYTVVGKLSFDSVENWSLANIENPVFDGTAKGNSTTGDPSISSMTPIGIKADDVKLIRIKAKMPVGTAMEIFFSTDDDKSFSESKAYRFYSSGEEIKEYIIKTESCENWKGNIYGFRVDPVTNAGLSFEVVSVEFLAE